MQETPTTSTPPSRVDKFRLWIKTLAGNTFGAPYLPIGLTAFFVTTVITNLAIVLMSQPYSYWENSGRAVGVDIFGGPLTAGPLALIIIVIVYLIIAVLLLSFVNYRWSLVGWLTAEIAHFYFIQQTLDSCYISRWSASLSGLCYAAQGESFWFIAIILAGILLAFSFQPAGFSMANKKIERGVLRFAGALPIVWMLIMIGGVIWSVQKPAYGWVPVEVDTKPGPLQNAEVAFDTRRNRLVLFGGASANLGGDKWDLNNDTWEWDGNQWIKMTPKENPPGRMDHALAYDERRGVVVMFGGCGANGRLSDTWEWNGETWTQRSPFFSPPTLSGHGMFYDPVRKKVVLYGGYDGSEFSNDAWAWDGDNWEEIELDGESPAASIYALAYNTDKDYAFGLLSGSPGGTWKWKDKTWTRLYPNPEPSNRGWTSLVYDPSRKLFFTFGGQSGDEVLNDTWTFDGRQWTQYTGGGIQPSARADMTIWYDPIRKRVMLYGGRNGYKVYDDMWEFIPPQE